MTLPVTYLATTKGGSTPPKGGLTPGRGVALTVDMLAILILFGVSAPILLQTYAGVALPALPMAAKVSALVGAHMAIGMGASGGVMSAADIATLVALARKRVAQAIPPAPEAPPPPTAPAPAASPGGARRRADTSGPDGAAAAAAAAARAGGLQHVNAPGGQAPKPLLAKKGSVAGTAMMGGFDANAAHLAQRAAEAAAEEAARLGIGSEDDDGWGSDGDDDTPPPVVLDTDHPVTWGADAPAAEQADIANGWKFRGQTFDLDKLKKFASLQLGTKMQVHMAMNGHVNQGADAQKTAQNLDALTDKTDALQHILQAKEALALKLFET